MIKKEYRYGKHIEFKHAIGKTDIYGYAFHDYYEIYILLRGEVEFISGSTRQKLHPFELIVIPPGEYHQFIVGSSEQYERCTLHIYPPFFEDGLLSTLFTRPMQLALSESHRIAKHFSYLTDCLSSISVEDFYHVLPAIATDILFLIKNHPNEQAVSAGSLQSLSLQVMRYLDEHFSKPLDLKQLSLLFYCSVSSLCHTFKQDFDISIKQYLTQKRMSVANLAIQKGEKPETVSLRCGFSNYSTFYRAYKRHFGYAPSDTKKQLSMPRYRN